MASNSDNLRGGKASSLGVGKMSQPNIHDAPSHPQTEKSAKNAWIVDDGNFSEKDTAKARPNRRQLAVLAIDVLELSGGDVL